MARGVVSLSAIALVGVQSNCVLKAEAPDQSPIDAAAVPVDAATPDAVVVDAAPDTACKTVDNDVVLYMTMNRGSETTWPDLLGANDGRSEPVAADSTDGPTSECGRAFDNSGGVRLVVDNALEFDLAVGSFDIYVRVPAPGLERGIVSRDADGADLPGHLDLVFSPNNQVVIRVQLATDMQAYRCAPIQNEGEWIHIGVNFGPPDFELYVDGVLAEEAEGTHNNVLRTCGGQFLSGIAGNTNPWLLGASGMASLEGTGEPAIRPLETAVDEFRVSRVRRAY